MEFLVEIEVDLPPHLDPEAKAELLARESERGHDLRAGGTIQRIWRIPGRTANVGIWAAEDATVLHEAITSLPLHAYMDVHVTALAQHYLEAD